MPQVTDHFLIKQDHDLHLFLSPTVPQFSFSLSLLKTRAHLGLKTRTGRES